MRGTDTRMFNAVQFREGGPMVRINIHGPIRPYIDSIEIRLLHMDLDDDDIHVSRYHYDPIGRS